MLDLNPAKQVRCAAKADYSHAGIRLVPDIEILRLKPDMRAINWKPFFETEARLGATQVLCAWNDNDIHRLEDNFAELCEIAHPFGLTLNIELMPWCGISTIV